MSGICGIVAFDCPRPSDDEICSMAAVLERRGPDGTSTFVEGSVALGHTLLAITPRESPKSLPILDPESGCVITADARIDNRNELSRLLSLSSSYDEVGDSELILAAYLRWGEACLNYLIGDFAFAIWDKRNQTLFAARDQVGVRQLIYHHRPGKPLVFATEAQALLRHSSVEGLVNEGRLADFAEGLEAFDLTSTFFESVYRLPPAHKLIFRPSGIRIERYWEMKFPEKSRKKNEKEYIEEFLDIFSKAVNSRLIGDKYLGATLSGGLDSGAIVAVASQLLHDSQRGALRTFSATNSNDGACKETSAIGASSSMPFIAPTFFSLEEVDAYRSELLAQIAECGEPFDAQMTILRAIYLKAQQLGVKVMLNGAAADMVLSAPYRIAHLLGRGQFVQAWREAKGEENFWGPWAPASSSLWRGARQVLVPPVLRDLIRRAPRRDASVDQEVGSLKPEFAVQVGMAGRRSAERVTTGRSGFSVFRDVRDNLLHPYTVVAAERYDRVAGMFGIQSRDPFLDLRLIRFCATLPLDQLQRNGWPKYILRQAMVGRLPATVCWRRGKEHLGLQFTRQLLRQISPSPDVGQNLQAAIGNYFNDPLAFEFETMQDDGEFRSAVARFYLARWLAFVHRRASL